MTEQNITEKIKSSRAVYEQIEIPDALAERMAAVLAEETTDETESRQADRREQTRREQIRREQKEGLHMKMKRKHFWRTCGIAAACAVFCFTAGLNASPAFAQEMSKLPLIGSISKVLTFRVYDYTLSEDGESITVTMPQIDDTAESAQTANDAIQKIVAEYEAQAQEDIAAYKEAFLATGGTEEEFAAKQITADIFYDIKSETEDRVSFVLYAQQNWNSSTAQQYYYNIDLQQDREITLQDLLGEDYIAIANEQIEAAIAADSSGLFFSKEEGGFDTVTDESHFYINEAGNPVIVFDQYEIAAGAAGMPEFEILP